MTWQGKRRAHLPADWRARRAAVLDRDSHRCRINGPRCTHIATEVDHAQHRDDHRLEHLRSACHTCHAERTAHQAAEARTKRARRPSEPPPGLIA